MILGVVAVSYERGTPYTLRSLIAGRESKETTSAAPHIQAGKQAHAQGPMMVLGGWWFLMSEVPLYTVVAGCESQETKSASPHVQAGKRRPVALFPPECALKQRGGRQSSRGCQSGLFERGSRRERATFQAVRSVGPL